MTCRRPCLKGKQPHHEVVELEAGRIDIPEFAVLDGVVIAIASIVKNHKPKRFIELNFPYFSSSLVYSPKIEAGGSILRQLNAQLVLNS